MSEKNSAGNGFVGVKNKERTLAERNRAFVAGQVTTNLEYNYSGEKDRFYRIIIKTEMRRGIEDYITVIIPEELLFDKNPVKGKWAKVKGQFRSFKRIGTSSRVERFVFAKDIIFYEDASEMGKSNENYVFVEGYVSTKYELGYVRGEYPVSNFDIAVHRNYDKIDYIHCSGWHENALDMDAMKVGDHVRIYGSIRSRKRFVRYVHDVKDATAGEWITQHSIAVRTILKIDEEE